MLDLDLNIETACSFTGHRRLPLAEIDAIQERLTLEIEKLITKNGVCNFLTGGAVGFDTLAAMSVIRLKIKYPEIRLYLLLPHYGQANNFSESERYVYDIIFREANEVYYLAKRYEKGCMLKRNKALVDNAKYLISYCNRDTGGTANTLHYARFCKVNDLNLAIK